MQGNLNFLLSQQQQQWPDATSLISANYMPLANSGFMNNSSLCKQNTSSFVNTNRYEYKILPARLLYGKRTRLITCPSEKLLPLLCLTTLPCFKSFTVILFVNISIFLKIEMRELFIQYFFKCHRRWNMSLIIPLCMSQSYFDDNYTPSEKNLSKQNGNYSISQKL